MSVIPASVNINIPEAFNAAFGIYARFPLFILGNARPGAVQRSDKMEEWVMPVPQSPNTDPFTAPSGAVLWDRFGFTHPDIPGTDPIFYLPIICTAEIGKRKNIVKTQLIGKGGRVSGTVKEIMSLDDHVITFRGLVINWENRKEYPTQKVNDINKLFDINASLGIVSKLFNDAHGITDIVTEDIKWNTVEGYADIQSFEITALSDTNIILDFTQ